MERAGGIGTFHVLFYFAISAGCNNLRAFLNHMIPFLIQKQVYKCQLVDDVAGVLPALDVIAHDEICTQENICAGDARILSWAVDFSNDRSLHNWVEQLDLMCEPEWKGGLLGTAFYFSWCLALLVIPRLADKIGRKWLFLVSRLVECVLFLATLCIRSYWGMFALLCALGVAAAGRINVGTVFMTEWCQRKHQTKVHMLSQTGLSITLLSCVIFYWVVSDETMYVSGFGYVLCLVTTGLAFVVPESPRLLVAQGKTAEV